MEEKELISSSDEFLITQICEILKQNNIAFIRKDLGVGAYINVIYGNISSFEKKIIVNSEDYEKARSLIEFMFKEDDGELPDELKEIDEDEDSMPDELKEIYEDKDSMLDEPKDAEKDNEKKYYLPAKIFRFFIICGILSFVVAMVASVVKMFI